MNITPAQLRHQVEHIQQNGFLTLLKSAATLHGLPLAYVVAVASRETNCQHILGDGGHGVGIIQIDIRFHEIARRMKANGTWKTNPGPLVDYGVKMLADGVAWAKRHWPDFTERQWLKISASAYNAGQGGATVGVAAGDSDLRTTGHDYGADVMARMKVIEGILG